jgi:hypothetical protein
MAAEVKLEPGWLIRDVRKASDRLKEWATSRTGPSRRSAAQQVQDSASDRSHITKDERSRKLR